MNARSKYQVSYMSHFRTYYKNFKYPIHNGEESGFRRAQIGAIHSVAGHFSTKTESAIITMPTGSGKTAVLISLAYILRATRVLIITPSRLVREQITEEVATLRTLKGLGAFAADQVCPKVMSTQHRITSAEAWEAMREFDVVVATVQSISPEMDEIPNPPADLFDFVLVDEAHHSPARTWQAVLSHFSSAKCVLFTATPFRQDQKEIKGRFVYTYTLHEAFEDDIFGVLNYSPVIPEPEQNHDVAIALAVEQQFNRDRESGYNHRIMVRTDGVTRANQLYRVYVDTTRLRLAVIHGGTALSTVKRYISNLETGDLDGIICVNMLGEGFNFPALKIAAIHAPHKSLTVTLQFVGRFARTVGANLGPAHFFAVPSDIKIESERLYDSQGIWQEIIHNLAAMRIEQEVETQEILGSFGEPQNVEELADFSLNNLTPYYHVKVYSVSEDVAIDQVIAFPAGLNVVYRSISDRLNAAIYITREISQPQWTDDDRLAKAESELFIFFYDQDSRLLFLCASRRSDGLYEAIIDSFADAYPRPLSLVRLNRALNDLQATEFFNVGMRNRVASNTSESYRIISGSSADKSVSRNDSRLYHRGHLFGKGIDAGQPVTIGLSSASKIWSNTSSRIPELIKWCKKLAVRINSGRNPVTNSGVDFLDPGEELAVLPNNIIAVDWPSDVYNNPPSIQFSRNGVSEKVQLLDCDLVLDGYSLDMQSLAIKVEYGNYSYRFHFGFEADKFFEPDEQNDVEVEIVFHRHSVDIIDYLNEDQLGFYTTDLSRIEGYSIFRTPDAPIPPFDDHSITTIDWRAQNVNIRREFGNAGAGLISIHQYYQNTLAVEDADVVYYDHGSGEIADFVSFKRNGNRVLVRFYHCKGSLSVNPGHRVDALYELTGQVIKSVTWALSSRLLGSIRRRFNERKGSHTFVRGNLNTLDQLLGNTSSASLDFEFIAVQPGLLKDALPVELSSLLAAANDYLIRGGIKPLVIHAS